MAESGNGKALSETSKAHSKHSEGSLQESIQRIIDTKAYHLTRAVLEELSREDKRTSLISHIEFRSQECKRAQEEKKLLLKQKNEAKWNEYLERKKRIDAEQQEKQVAMEKSLQEKITKAVNANESHKQEIQKEKQNESATIAERMEQARAKNREYYARHQREIANNLREREKQRESQIRAAQEKKEKELLAHKEKKQAMEETVKAHLAKKSQIDETKNIELQKQLEANDKQWKSRREEFESIREKVNKQRQVEDSTKSKMEFLLSELQTAKNRTQLIKCLKNVLNSKSGGEAFSSLAQSNVAHDEPEDFVVAVGDLRLSVLDMCKKGCEMHKAAVTPQKARQAFSHVPRPPAAQLTPTAADSLPIDMPPQRENRYYSKWMYNP